MLLTTLFRLHAVLAAAYALALLLIPRLIVGLLAAEPLIAVGTAVARLFGAALTLVAVLAWGAAGLSDRMARRLVAASLLLYSVLGLGITLWGQLDGTWNTLGW